jgi:hypothetical protein
LTAITVPDRRRACTTTTAPASSVTAATRTTSQTHHIVIDLLHISHRRDPVRVHAGDSFVASPPAPRIGR